MFRISHYSVARWRCGQGSQVAKAPEYKLMAHTTARDGHIRAAPDSTNLRQ
jgi:hypothetical protein